MRSTIWSEVKVLLLATLVAALVWVYAEGESLTARSVSVGVNFADEGDVVIRADDPNWRGVARVRLEGSTRTIDAAANFLNTRLRLVPGAAGMPAEPGERTIDLREAISQTQQLKNLGSSVAEVDPQFLRVRVVRLVTRELPVRVEMGLEIPLDGDPNPTPSSVVVRLSEQAASALPEGASAIATLSAEDLRRIRTDGPQTISALVKAPTSIAGPDIPVCVPESVSVAIRVRRKVETHTIASVPVWFSLPPTEDAGKWNVEVLDKFLSDVSISGPSDEVQRVKSGEVAVKALIQFSTDDLEKGVTSRPVTFTALPPNVQASVSNASVRVRVTRQGGGGGSGAGGGGTPGKP